MNRQELSIVISRIDEMKSLFHFGQRMLPLIEDFFEFLREIIPLLEGINQSIEDSNAKLPRASKELNKVTQATEDATIEILDILDIMTQEVITARNALGVLGNVLASGTPAQREAFASVEKALSGLGEHTGNITIALQVQDITAQQVSTVNHLVESVHDRLSKLLEGFTGTDLTVIDHELKTTAQKLGFDSDAQWTRTGDRQELADSHFAQQVAPVQEKPSSESVGPNGIVSQDEVDKFFR